MAQCPVAVEAAMRQVDVAVHILSRFEGANGAARTSLAPGGCAISGAAWLYGRAHERVDACVAVRTGARSSTSGG
eukprot:6220356-Alexandrium_andersonii.AAC.1